MVQATQDVILQVHVLSCTQTINFPILVLMGEIEAVIVNLMTFYRSWPDLPHHVSYLMIECLSCSGLYSSQKTQFCCDSVECEKYTCIYRPMIFETKTRTKISQIAVDYDWSDETNMSLQKLSNPHHEERV